LERNNISYCLLVQLDAILNAEKNSSLQKVKEKGTKKEKTTLTVSSRKEEKMKSNMEGQK